MLSRKQREEIENATQLANYKLKIKEEFISQTDRKYTFRHIKKLVDIVKRDVQDCLEEKRNRLRELLKTEQIAYRDEFRSNVKSRVEESVRQRQESLMALKIEKAKEEQELVRMKNIQKHINNCDDIRTKLRKDLLQETKQSQLAQMRDKCTERLRERQEDHLWLQVRNSILEEQEKREKYENCLRQKIIEEAKQTLERQILDREEAKELKKRREHEERLRVQEELKAAQQDEASLKILEAEKRRKQGEMIRKQYQEGIKQKRMLQEQEKQFECLYNVEMVRQREEEEKLLKMKVSSLRESTLRYLEHLNEMKKEMDIDRKNDEIAFEEYRKRNECEQIKKMEAIKIQKQKLAKEAHQELLTQICDNEERKLRATQDEYLSDVMQKQIWENEKRSEEAKNIAEQEKIREHGKELMNQIEGIRQFKAEEKERFAEDLRRAAEQEDYCLTLAKKFIDEKINYLPHHPNWELISCPCIKDPIAKN